MTGGQVVLSVMLSGFGLVVDLYHGNIADDWTCFTMALAISIDFDQKAGTAI